MPVDTRFPIGTVTNASSNNRPRAQSTSSDRQSTIGIYSLMSPPLSVSPDAAFIAASAASQIVTNAFSATWYDQVGIEPAADTVLVSNSALQLANNFVDQLLFNVLSTARSTSLASLRSAVVDVLKPKLAKDVINSADEELREYLGGREIESLAHSPSPESARSWDLELVWKKTRLRCMVYSSLGDMEDEDEDYYIEQGHLNGEDDEVLNDLVSPAVAIFLTSILEFMGEQVLIVAGQAAFNRLCARYEKELKDGTRLPGAAADRIVVEELDMERVALDRTLGRLWRAWKKRIRSPMEPNFSRPFSRSSGSGSGFSHQRRESTATELPAVPPSPELDTATDGQLSYTDGIQDRTPVLIKCEDAALDPSLLPLPDSDVEASYSDEEESDREELPLRPKSWLVTSNTVDARTPEQLIKRTPSLPSRKKPGYSSIVSREDTWDTKNSGSPGKLVGTSQLPNLPEIKSEAETLPITGEATRAVDKTSPDTAGAGGAIAPGLIGIAIPITAPANITGDESDGEIEYLEEEPEILTSSRISVGGTSSPTASEPGRPSSIVLTRSDSIRSVRVIEVQGHRSRASSIESNPRSLTPRSFSISREGSISRTPPIVEENDFYEVPYEVPYVTVAKTTPGSVSSSAEVVRDVITTLAPPPRNRSPPKSIRSPITIHTSAQTKMNTNTNITGLQQEEYYDNLPRPISGLRNPPMPTLPERSASRPIYTQTTSTQRPSPESPRLARPAQSESPPPVRFKAKRASEESSSSRSADVARNFEELIQSNETLQYTLTPENMRDIDSQSSLLNDSPKASTRARKSVDSQIRETSRPSSTTTSTSVNKSMGPAGLPSNPPTDLLSNANCSNPSPRALPPVSMRNRTGPVPQARDARIPRESMLDFADFIRSTGPAGADTRANGSSTRSSNTARSITGQPITNSPANEVRRGPKLQARDAVVNTATESSELIDFIRQGPPNTNGNDHRIPRTVAPFRNTQDSDYMTSAVGGKAIDAVIPNVRTSQGSTNVTEASATSSMNSQSALLNKSNRQQPYAGNSFGEDDVMPKRTRRRVYDPYALDSSDEDEDYGFDRNLKPQPQREESLMDFLNNCPPPAEPSTPRVVPPKKKSSAPNLIARLRSGSSSGQNGTGHGRKGSGMSESRSISSRMGPKVTHTPIVVPNAMDRYGPSMRSSNSPRTASYGRVPMKKFEPREASLSRSQTADLADFLRDSQPPPAVATFPSQPEDKSSSGFSRMFERRKK
ncbi:hypothetical protein F5B18DRAFT_400961 [Nemania serpens]|nr:hypothetical protein F5B18DRAFT_400961 [Nemania serpens]